MDPPDDVDLYGNVDMERDGEDEEEEEEEEEDEEEVDEDEEEDKDDKEDKDEDDGKRPRTIGQGEMVNSSADNVDTMVDPQRSVLPEQHHKMRDYTPRPQPPAPTPRRQTLEPRP